jgi:poly(beta-D-mannuronate) lyase
VVKSNIAERNFFTNHTYSGENGGECMRVGNSKFKSSRGFNVIESNLFERCNGDPEIISNKSSDNTFRSNTFRNNAGALTLRHGHRALVDGNYWLGGDGGVRIYGNDHLVVNNYFHQTSGKEQRSPIALGAGTMVDETDTSAGYDRPDRVVVLHNTLIGNASHVAIGAGSGDMGPADCAIARNLIVASSSTAVANVAQSPSNLTWTKNVIWGSSSTGGIPADGFTRADPRHILMSDGVYRLQRASPVVDPPEAAFDRAPTIPTVTTDIDGQPRVGTADIGADEFATAAATHKPLTQADVGPNAP